MPRIVSNVRRKILNRYAWGTVYNVSSFTDNEATSGKGATVSMGIRQCTVSKFKASNKNSSEDSSIAPLHIHTSKCIMLLEVTIAVCLLFD